MQNYSKNKDVKQMEKYVTELDLPKVSENYKTILNAFISKE